MTYKAHRDYRFEYVGDVIEFIEERQCVTCKFQTDDPSMPMCWEFSGAIVCEEPVEELDDLGDDGIVCRKYEPLPPEPEPVDEYQLKLF